jgi:glycine/D-amino acid oxidase-like deaminating enzyme
MRVVVLGAGIVGLHLAAELARHGAEVIVLERGEPGEGTSGASFAWIDASHPGLAPYLDLRLLGVRAWQRCERDFGATGWLSLPGTMTWATSASGRQQLEAHVARLEARGRGPERLTAAQVARRAPELRVPAGPGPEVIYFFAGEGFVYTRPALAALVDRAAAAGARVRTGAEARELVTGAEGRVTGVALASGESVEGELVVSCLGRWTQSLLEPAGVDVPMVDPDEEGSPAVGLVVLTAPGPARLSAVVCADGVVVRPEHGGRLLIHSDAHDEGIPGSVDPARAATAVLARVKEILPSAGSVSVQEARVCVRALPIDFFPVVGSARPGLYVVATHSGVTLAPALAELVARELIGGRPQDALAPFRPRWPAGQAA